MLGVNKLAALIENDFRFTLMTRTEVRKCIDSETVLGAIYAGNLKIMHRAYYLSDT